MRVATKESFIPTGAEGQLKAEGTILTLVNRPKLIPNEKHYTGVS